MGSAWLTLHSFPLGPCACLKKKSAADLEKPKKKRILTNVNGVVEPGTLIRASFVIFFLILIFMVDFNTIGSLLAIMGPSGSGKTTLLNTLSGRLSGLHDGTVYLNAVPSNRRAMKRYATFVPQEDVLVGTQTVHEAVDFAARMKLPTTVPDAERARLVDEIIRELGLSKVSQSLIGYTGSDAANSGLPRGLSGGERKRLSVACQLVTNPSLLFLDEPTTGLDSFSALSVVSTLSNLAQQGRTIIFTVHQPSAEIFEMFDQVLFVSRGRITYLGPRDRAVDYFASIGHHCPVWENPADFVLNLINGGETGETPQAGTESSNGSGDAATQLAIRLETAFKNSTAASLLKPAESPPALSMDKQANRPGFFQHIANITKRQLLNLWREPALLRAGLGQCIFVALLLGLTFLRQGNNQTALNNRAGAVFFGCAYMMFAGLLIPFQICAC